MLHTTLTTILRSRTHRSYAPRLSSSYPPHPSPCLSRARFHSLSHHRQNSTNPPRPKANEKPPVKKTENQPLGPSQGLNPKTNVSKTLPFESASSSKEISSKPELVSSFQEPLVGLSPPLAGEQEKGGQTGSDSNATDGPAANPATSLTTRQPAAQPTILPTHAFHTHRFVQQLERSNYTLGASQQLLSFVEHSLRAAERRWLLTGPAGGVVSRSYAEGQAYLYDAALGELRTEVRVKARNDGIVLKSASNGVQREIDALRQKLKEDIDGLKNEIQLEMNGRKEEASDDQKKLELAIQELNSKFTILVSDVRTDIETRKWVTTRRCVVAIASLALCVVIFTALENQQMISSPSGRQIHEQIMRSAEELGILPDKNDGSSSEYPDSFLSNGGPRVGEEG